MKEEKIFRTVKKNVKCSCCEQIIPKGTKFFGGYKCKTLRDIYADIYCRECVLTNTVDMNDKIHNAIIKEINE